MKAVGGGLRPPKPPLYEPNLEAQPKSEGCWGGFAHPNPPFMSPIWPDNPRVQGDDDGDGGRIFPEHPSPILHAPRDNISRKGNPSLRL